MALLSGCGCPEITTRTEVYARTTESFEWTDASGAPLRQLALPPDTDVVVRLVFRGPPPTVGVGLEPRRVSLRYSSTGGGLDQPLPAGLTWTTEDDEPLALDAAGLPAVELPCASESRLQYRSPSPDEACRLYETREHMTECVALLRVRRDASLPLQNANVAVRYDARAAVLELRAVDSVDQGMPDAAVRLDASTCAATLCVNGTLRSDDGCLCVCDPGWLGEACDRGEPVISTAAGTAGMQGLVDGSGDTARLFYPGALALLDGRVIIADRGNEALRTYDPVSGVLGTLAGAPGRGSLDGPLATAGFGRIVDLAPEPDGGLLVLEADPVRIRRVADGVVSTLSHPSLDVARAIERGTDRVYVSTGWALLTLPLGGGELTELMPEGGLDWTDGQVPDVSVTSAVDLVLSPDGTHLLITEAGVDVPSGSLNGGAVRALHLGTLELTTLAGRTGFDRFRGDRLITPVAVASVDARTLVVVERSVHRLRWLLRPLGTSWVPWPLAGDPSTGSTDGDGEAGAVDGSGSLARFDTPSAVVVTPDGSLYVSDAGNHTLRRVVTR